MNRDAIEYLVRDLTDWANECWTTTSRAEAYRAWAENQDLEVVELCTAEGYCRCLNDDFADEFIDDCKQARSQARHERSFAPCRQTHGAA